MKYTATPKDRLFFVVLFLSRRTFKKMTKTILVFGATGNQGSAVVRALKAPQRAGDDITIIRCLVRNPDSEKSRELARLGCELVKGDLTDVASMTAAMRGVDAVYLLTMNTSPPSSAGCEQETNQGLNAVEALKAAKVPYVLYSSACSADRGTGIPHFESKGKVERAILDTGIPAFFLRPCVFFQKLDNAEVHTTITQGNLTFMTDPDVEVQWVDTDDIGAVAAIVLLDPQRFAGKSLELSGERISGNQMAAQLAELRGNGETWAYKTGAPLWLLDFVVPPLAIMFRYYNTVGLRDEMAESRRIYPQMTTWKQYCVKRGYDKKEFPTPSSSCSIM